MSPESDNKACEDTVNDYKTQAHNLLETIVKYINSEHIERATTMELYTKFYNLMRGQGCYGNSRGDAMADIFETHLEATEAIRATWTDRQAQVYLAIVAYLKRRLLSSETIAGPKTLKLFNLEPVEGYQQGQFRKYKEAVVVR